jgi:hypothetical protein
MGITSQESSVADIVRVEMVQCPVSVGLCSVSARPSVSIVRPYRVTIPLICVKGVPIDCAVVHAAEDDLVTNNSPGGAAVLRLRQASVEPILLGTAHKRATGVVHKFRNVVIVPVECGYATVVVSSVKHDYTRISLHYCSSLHILLTQIEQLAHLEVPPNAEIIVQVDLAYRHPLEVGAYCVHFTGVDTYAAELEERGFGIVHTTKAISVAIVRNLVIVPCRDPCKVLVGKTQV